MKIFLLSVLYVSIIFGCSESVSPKVSNQRDPANYKSWHKVTQEPHMAISHIVTKCAPRRSNDEMDLDKTDPHVKKPINIYLNEKGFEAYVKNMDYPPGSVIVKEKLDGNLQPFSIGAMIKQEDGIWHYYYKDTKIVQGRINTCVECHTRNDAKNEVFGFWSKPINEENRKMNKVKNKNDN